MPVSDVLARVSGLLMVLSAMWNGLLSFIYVLSLVWVCVGVLWFIPALLAVGVFACGVGALVVGYRPYFLAGPLVSLFVSVCNFNIIGLTLDMSALALMGVALMMRLQEDAAKAQGSM